MYGTPHMKPVIVCLFHGFAASLISNQLSLVPWPGSYGSRENMGKSRQIPAFRRKIWKNPNRLTVFIRISFQISLFLTIFVDTSGKRKKNDNVHKTKASRIPGVHWKTVKTKTNFIYMFTGTKIAKSAVFIGKQRSKHHLHLQSTGKKRGKIPSFHCPQIIHLNGIFHYKPTIWGYPHFRKPPSGNKNTPFSCRNPVVLLARPRAFHWAPCPPWAARDVALAGNGPGLGPPPSYSWGTMSWWLTPRIVSGWNNPGDFTGIFVGASRPLKKLGLELTHQHDSWDEPPSELASGKFGSTKYEQMDGESQIWMVNQLDGCRWL